MITVKLIFKDIALKYNILEILLKAPLIQLKGFDEPDVILLNHEVNLVRKIKELKVKYPLTKIVAITENHSAQNIINSFLLGIEGYICKDKVKKFIIENIIQIYNGGIVVSPCLMLHIANYIKIEITEEKVEVWDLSNREVEIAQLLLKGQTFDEIANMLFISVNTVKFHLKNIYFKFDVNSKSQLILELHKQKFSYKTT